MCSHSTVHKKPFKTHWSCSFPLSSWSCLVTYILFLKFYGLIGLCITWYYFGHQSFKVITSVPDISLATPQTTILRTPLLSLKTVSSLHSASLLFSFLPSLSPLGRGKSPHVFNFILLINKKYWPEIKNVSYLVSILLWWNVTLVYKCYDR